VPATAIVRQGSEEQLLTVDKDGRVKTTKVVTVSTDGDRVALKEGPPAGTSIVVNPDGIKSGDLINQRTK